MVEAARHGQLSTVRKLLNRGAATVDDQDEVKCVCVFVCMCVLCVSAYQLLRTVVGFHSIPCMYSMSIYATITFGMPCIIGSECHSVANSEFGGV